MKKGPKSIKILVYGIPMATMSSGAINFKTGGGTYADHRSDSEDQAVERQNQVQGGDTVRTLGQGDEKSICQHIGR